MAAPIIPADLLNPQVESPQLQQPSLRSAQVKPPSLSPPRVVEPELRESYQVDRYQQKSVVVDILWILDNSGSMENERERLAESFERFIQILQTREIDYHLGVISTDPEQARLREEGERRFLTPELEDSQAEALFRAMVEFPQARNQKEQGLEAMRRLLEFEQERGDFLRREAALAVVVVSDEDDGSFGAPAYFSRVLQNSRRPGDELRASFSAIVGFPLRAAPLRERSRSLAPRWIMLNAI